MLLSSYTHINAHTLSNWECRMSLFLPGKGLSENLRGRQEGTRWRPLQIWLLLTVLWSAHVYLLSQHWYLGLCGAWDAGPSVFEVKLIPQTTLLVIASSFFSCALSSLTPPPCFLSSLFSFFFFTTWDLEDADGELLEWLYASSNVSDLIGNIIIKVNMHYVKCINFQDFPSLFLWCGCLKKTTKTLLCNSL